MADIPEPLLIVTTSYHDLLEQAFKSRNRPYHLVVHPTDSKDLAGAVLWWKPDAIKPEPFPPAKLPLSVSDTTIIYKMHGTVDRRDRHMEHSFVISEEDYIDFLSRMTGDMAIPARFMLHFRDRQFLFLGYGLADPNLRVCSRISRTLPTLPPKHSQVQKAHRRGQFRTAHLNLRRCYGQLVV